MAKEWIIEPEWPGRMEAARRLGVSPIVAQILHNRSLDDVEAARQFLSPQLGNLHPPEQLPGVVEAAERIGDAVRANRKIVLYGDYDVDGIAGVAILWHVLRMGGADVDFYVPHRLEEGYGLNADALRKIAEQGAKLVITVDCGVTACAEARLAREVGLELIITDHHAPKEELPEGLVVHPALESRYPNPHLCGAGVAFKLAWAIAQRLSGSKKVTPEFREYLIDATSLAALGTIADVVPLVGENRVIARFGLTGLAASKQPGIAALIDAANLRSEKLDAYHVGFWLAPRINAAGRMGHARLAVELFTRADAARAREIAAYLEDQNKQRQTIERKTLKHAVELVEHRRMDADGCHGIVLAEENWHAGVIGIVAARLVERFHRPTVLIAMDGETGQGSGRSVRHFHLHDALARCQEHLMTFGGHEMAAGLRIRRDRVGAFTEAFTQVANNRLSPADLRAKIRLDGEARLAELDEKLVTDVGGLGPFGPSNPRPKLATDWLAIDGEPRCVGRSGDHLQFALRENGKLRKAIGFRLGGYLQDLLDHRRCRVAFVPILNEFNGSRNVELEVIDIQFPETSS
jgi:single-stranded-DNA-specific exonuclease